MAHRNINLTDALLNRIRILVGLRLSFEVEVRYDRRPRKLLGLCFLQLRCDHSTRATADEGQFSLGVKPYKEKQWGVLCFYK